ncbi:TlpA disulfide reductase family protein [Oceanicoccus sp. KOV_DT_Chl]|uniref:TlpA family protein disulfide reductase n=1 Tax=Oceanicoccus sp. KOV_DT_Chl TaxID=1904639 RepID=UPI000C7E3CEC|nr:TlpA disulfide reductase family protein [Oceanicoccus sp. KOV_DT_Chl]
MRRINLSLAIIICLLTSSCNQHNESTINSSDFEGWLVINYWASWCKPCIQEIPELNHLATSKANSLTVLGVDYDNSQGQALQEKISQLGIKFTVLHSDPAAELNYPRPSVLPTTIIINPQKQLHKTLIGPQTEQSILQAIYP